MAEPAHPMQPIVLVEGVARFKENKAIRWMVEQGGEGTRFDLNDVAAQLFPAEDMMQLVQLLGYSVSGYGDLSFASEESVAKADAEVERL